MEGSPQCGHEGFFLLLQKLVLLLQVADLGIFQQTLQSSLNLPLNISPCNDKDKENELEKFIGTWFLSDPSPIIVHPCH